MNISNVFIIYNFEYNMDSINYLIINKLLNNKVPICICKQIFSLVKDNELSEFRIILNNIFNNNLNLFNQLVDIYDESLLININKDHTLFTKYPFPMYIEQNLIELVGKKVRLFSTLSNVKQLIILEYIYRYDKNFDDVFDYVEKINRDAYLDKYRLNC